MNKQRLSKILAGLFLSVTLLGNTSIAVKAETSRDISVSKVQAKAIDPSWGLGKNQTESVSNNRTYSWYIDQGHTGKYSDSNCGPSSVTMSLKWINGSFSKTAEDARNTYRSTGGWWYTDDIVNYLKLNKAKYTVLQNTGEALLKSQIKQGNIAIICANMKYIPYNSNSEQRVGRFYEYADGHFFVVKGYKVVDGKTYFEVYDPNNWDSVYRNGQPKGKDRYYLSSDLMTSVSKWWNYFIIVQGNTKKATNSIDMYSATDVEEKVVDISKIPSARGK